MTNRVFDFTSGSAGKKGVGYGDAHLFQKGKTQKTFRAVVVLYFDYKDTF